MSKPQIVHDATGILSSQPGNGHLAYYGVDVPTDGAIGYSPGCLFIHTDGTAGTVLYVNQGTAASCDFNAADLAVADKAVVDTLSDLTATMAELNRSADASARIVTTTATVLALTVTEHAERIVLVNTNSTVANTVTLPAATGSGCKFTIVNNIVQTQGTVVFAANGTDVFAGKCIALDSTAAADAMTFLTSATSDKVTLNLTTTGGLGYDKMVAVDAAANTWYVEVEIVGSGNMATPFSAT